MIINLIAYIVFWASTKHPIKARIDKHEVWPVTDYSRSVMSNNPGRSSAFI